MLPKQAISYSQLRKEGYSKAEIESMSAGLKLFPTPFKGIYYVPLGEERGGWFIEKPLKALSLAISLYLGSNEFYYTCSTAEEALGTKWNPSEEVHVVNRKLSDRMDIRERAGRNMRKGTYRAKKIAHLLLFYGNVIVFHRTAKIAQAKVRETPYGRFATRAQIKIDRKRFRTPSL